MSFLYGNPSLQQHLQETLSTAAEEQHSYSIWRIYFLNTHCTGDGEEEGGGGYDVLSSSWSMLSEKDGAVIGYQQKTLRAGK